jgi:hypothetical protein
MTVAGPFPETAGEQASLYQPLPDDAISNALYFGTPREQRNLMIPLARLYCLILKHLIRLRSQNISQSSFFFILASLK